MDLEARCTSFRKCLPLPNCEKYQIIPEDCVISGNVLCYIKYKRLLFNHSSKLLLLPTTLTKQGFLIIHKTCDSGFSLKINEVISLSVETTTYVKRKVKKWRCCRMKLKFFFGSLYIFLMDDDIRSWKSQIENVFYGVSPQPTNTIHEFSLRETEVSYRSEVPVSDRSFDPVPTAPCVTVSFVSARSAIDCSSENSKFFEEEWEELENTQYTGSQISLVEVPESSVKEEKLPEANLQRSISMNSIRSGCHSVAALRRYFERKMRESGTVKRRNNKYKAYVNPLPVTYENSE